MPTYAQAFNAFITPISGSERTTVRLESHHIHCGRLWPSDSQFILLLAVSSSWISADHLVQPRSKTSLRLMPLGGSVTYGVGSSSGNGYREFLRAMLVAHGNDLVIVGSRNSGSMSNNENEGWRGYRLDQIDKKVRSSIEKLAPNIFAINAGSNDCIQDFKLGEFRERISDIVHFLWQTDPSSTVVLSTLLVNADDTVNSRVLRVNEQIRDFVAQETSRNSRIVLADMHGAEGPQVDDLVDGTHPGDTGYQIMAGIWFDAFQKARGKGFFTK
uniref:SGNH hydrolase-type esterase domain-containing protein n=1 Tax=Bionectria ochroleuca TaxID=29856 RepID=A0A0B7K569_BIOOC